MSRDALAWAPSRFDVATQAAENGCLYVRPVAELEAYPLRVTDTLECWAADAPERVFVARRSDGGDWDTVSYRDALRRVRTLAAGLVALDLGVERPLLILSGNSIEHLLLGLAAMYAGIPYCPVSPAYARAGSALDRLRYVVNLLTPGAVATFGESTHGAVIEAVAPRNCAVIGDAGPVAGRRALALDELMEGNIEAAESAHAQTGADTVAKFLLTSGSTGNPKPVITTNRMLCSNQVMLRQAVPFVADEPPVLVDWLPWNHTFGGSHNVGLVLFNGGTLYIDDGKPVAGSFRETVRNLREISPTIYFNVPKGFDMLAGHLQSDDALRENFYRRLRACFFAGASLGQHTWDALDAAARREGRDRVPMLAGLGCTEASPSITFTTPDIGRAGVIGLPAAGNEVKLAPIGDKLELRVRGPNVTPGYWRLPDESKAAFDEEGYYRLGDAVRLLDPDDAAQGMVFDGRISEDFKLASGTWVSTGPLRASLLEALAPLAQDIVVAGLDRDYIGVLIVPDVDACRLFAGVERDLPVEQLLGRRQIRDQVLAALGRHAADNRASSKHARRAILLSDPLSIDRGEITDKGSVNQGNVLRVRAGLVADLYANPPPKHVLTLP